MTAIAILLMVLMADVVLATIWALRLERRVSH